MKTAFQNLMAISTIVIISSCTRIEINNLEITPDANTVPFTAEVEDACMTKTALESLESSKYALVWTSGDEISISDGISSAVYSTSSNGKSSATFVWKSGKLSNAPRYSAFYPSTITKDNMVLPAEQEYVEDNVMDYPMYAESSNRTLRFKNLCGIVRFDITDGDESADYSVAAIHLSCDGKGMSGKFTIDEDNAAVVSEESGVTLRCKTAQALGTSEKSFNIIVPAGKYNAFKTVIEFSDGSSRTYMADGAVTVKRSGIVCYTISVLASDMSGALELISIENGNVDFTER